MGRDHLMRTPVLIVGGGLSGLHTAYELSREGIDFILIEARERLGGRILSFNVDGDINDGTQAGFDLGPAWFWPGQTRMEHLVRNLDLVDAVFTQYAAGDSLYEDGSLLHRGVTGFSMAGSYRLKAGMRQIISTLEQKIPKHRLLHQARLTRLENKSSILLVSIQHRETSIEIEAELVVMALPPRLAATTLKLVPPLTDSRVSELTAIPTWMAGHAKLVILYEAPFWRDQGFSGDVISHSGPMREIHDASPDLGGPYALFGFLGIAAEQRREQQEQINQAAIEQLVGLFGEAASKPLEIFYKDWAAEPETATADDQEMSNAHSFHRLAATAEAEWDNRIIWSGSETANSSERNGGFLEGALESSQTSLELIRSFFKFQQ